MHDVIVIGGSYAGLAAALQLARGRRDVLVVDAGQRRNRFARSAHGFLGRDGASPQAIVDAGRADVLAYPTAAWREGTVQRVTRDGEGFVVDVGTEPVRGKRVILATGVRDELPPVPGLAERWGARVFHCPYCHGYELERGPIAVLATSPMAMHSALLVADWGPTTLLLNGAFEPDAAQLAQLAAREVRLERTPVRRIAGAMAPGTDAGLEVHLADGRALALVGMFVLPHTVVSPLAASLGCVLEDGPLGAFVKVDMTKQTSVPGVFACGDTALAMGNVAIAVADGVMAGSGAHRSLIFQ